MTKTPTLEDHARIAEQFNEIIDRCVHLQVDISNTIGKTKSRKMHNNLGKAKDSISSIRWELENMMLDEYPDAPLYTSYRNYQNKISVTDSEISVSRQERDQERRKQQRMMREIQHMRKPIFSDTMKMKKR